MASDWAGGYVADIGYTYGYYQEMNPLHCRLALVHSRWGAPDIQTACELGFGQGLSTNFHAAGSTVEWYGTDFNPSQVAFAQQLGAASGAAVKLWDDAFTDFTQRADLPDFDFICLHGIWSWISDENRAAIVDFVRRKLKVGGLFYVSYNSLPGWAAFAPLRHLMNDHVEIFGSEERGIVGRIDDAMNFATRLMKTNPLFAAANPQIGERLEKVRLQDRHYLAHEYFNRDWAPMYVSDMARWLTPAKLSFAGSAGYLDHVEPMNLAPEQSEFLKTIENGLFRESTRDFMVNRQFRRDLWVKGPRRLSEFSQVEEIRRHRVTLAQPRSLVPQKIQAVRGEGNLTAEVSGPILDLLADYKPRTLGQIEQELAGHPRIKLASIVEVALLLGNTSSLLAAQDDDTAAQVRPRTDRLNRWILDLARESADIAYLVSPVTGGGIPVSRFDQLFLRAMMRGRKTANELAMETWEILSSHGQALSKSGVPMAGGEDNIAELIRQAEAFVSNRMPCLEGLGIL